MEGRRYESIFENEESEGIQKDNESMERKKSDKSDPAWRTMGET